MSVMADKAARPLGRLALIPAALIASVLSLAGCAATAPAGQAPVAYDPAISARIRVFGNNGFAVVFYPGMACIPADRSQGGTRVSGGAGQAFKALLRIGQNESIGMPLSRRAATPRNGVFAKEYFQEYVVPAAQPVALDMAYLGTPNSPAANMPLAGATVAGSARCGPFGGVFQPQAGQDYDVYPLVGNLICMSVVERIDEHGEGRTVQVADAPRCR
jgi:hypothetical protein